MVSFDPKSYELLFKAVGMMDDDIRTVKEKGIPVWVVVVGSAVVGGYVAVKFMPEEWLDKLRSRQLEE
jgi:hypothetical protein